MKKDWNELEFTNFNDFRRMAPSIIQLEITRLGKIINSLETIDSAHNLLVKARYDLTEFKRELDTFVGNDMDEDKILTLNSVIFCIASAAKNDISIKNKTDYILDRLTDLLQKCKMLY